MRTIYILWLRQIKRYIRKRSRIVGALGQPLLFLFALGYGLNPIYSQAGEGDYINFLSPGIIAMTILFTAIFTGTEIIWDKQFGFLKETLVAPVSRFQIMLGKTLGGATVSIIQGLLVLVVVTLVGFRPESAMSLIAALFFVTLIGVLFSAIGTTIASRLDDMQAFPLIINFIVQPLFFLSGALFPLNNLPPALSFITTVNPLTYGVDGIRGAFTGAYYFSFTTNVAVLSFCIAVALIVGAYQFSRIQA